MPAPSVLCNVGRTARLSGRGMRRITAGVAGAARVLSGVGLTAQLPQPVDVLVVHTAERPIED